MKFDRSASGFKPSNTITPQTPSIDPVILFKVKFSEPNAARTRNVVMGVNEFNMEDNPTVIFVCAKNIKVKGITLFSIPIPM